MSSLQYQSYQRGLIYFYYYIYAFINITYLFPHLSYPVLHCIVGIVLKLNWNPILTEEHLLPCLVPQVQAFEVQEGSGTS